MKNTTLLSKRIDNLITRFFYKEDQLCFRIMVKYDDGGSVPFCEYADYNEYKKAYAHLVERKRSNEVNFNTNTTVKQPEQSLLNFA